MWRLLSCNLYSDILNGNFNLTEFDQIRNASGSNAFVMTATKWVRETNAIGVKPSRERIIQKE